MTRSRQSGDNVSGVSIRGSAPPWPRPWALGRPQLPYGHSNKVAQHRMDEAPKATAIGPQQPQPGFTDERRLPLVGNADNTTRETASRGRA